MFFPKVQIGCLSLGAAQFRRYVAVVCYTAGCDEMCCGVSTRVRRISAMDSKVVGQALYVELALVRQLFKPRPGGGGAAGADEVVVGIENFDC